MIKKIKENEFSQVQASKLAVVDFSATWCGPCKMLAPVLEEISNELAGKAEFFNIDVDECPALAMQFGIQSIPALTVFQNGEKKDMQVGFVPKENVMQFLAPFLE